MWLICHQIIKYFVSVQVIYLCFSVYGVNVNLEAIRKVVLEQKQQKVMTLALDNVLTNILFRWNGTKVILESMFKGIAQNIDFLLESTAQYCTSLEQSTAHSIL